MARKEKICIQTFRVCCLALSMAPDRVLSPRVASRVNGLGWARETAPALGRR